MKKTLILACSLLASVAQADLTLPSTDAYFDGSVDTLSSSNKLIKWDTTVLDSTLTNFALSFSIGQNTQNNEKTVISLSTENSGASGLCVTIDVNEGQPTVLTLTNGNLGWITSPAPPTVELAFDTVYTLAVVDNKAYLWQGEEIPTTLPDNGYDVSNYITTLDTTLSRGWSNGGVNTVTLGKVTDLSALAAPAVPEPTTATLSLLALAGLAARRRRK